MDAVNTAGTGEAKERLIREIIEREWRMFDRVQNAGGRASCQEDWRTFFIMRFSQHSAYSMEMLESYRQDLVDAEAAGRNLLTEKYAYMMEISDPEYYRRELAPSLPAISREKQRLIEEILERTMEDHRKFSAEYPAFSSGGRPAEQNTNGTVSVKSYTMGELKTYSERTLGLCLRDMQSAQQRGSGLIFAVQAMTAGFYGYRSLDEAEAAMSRRIGRI